MAENELKNAELRTPHSVEAERSVISCLLQNNTLVDVVFASIDSDMFYDPMYRAMFRAIGELRDKGFGIDKITLKDKVKSNADQIIENIGDIKRKVTEQGFDTTRLNDEFFVDLINAAPITSNVLDHCKMIKDKYILRKAIEISERLIIDCKTGDKDTKTLLNDAQGELFKYSKTTSSKDYDRIGSSIKEVLSKIEAASKTPDGITGVRTGYRMLDSRTSGFQNGNMIVLAARPGVGKTAFAMNLAYNICKKENQRVLFFSLEMGRDELLMRAISMETAISSSLLRKGNISQNQWTELINGAKRINNTNIYIDDNPYLTIAELRNKCMKFHSEIDDTKVKDIIIIDYLQLMHAGMNVKNSSTKGFGSRQEEVAEISRNIKAIAKELNVPIIALSQLSRASEERKRPQLSDLRESGAIEQDADIVMLIHSDRNNPDAEDKDKTEIIFAKHRNGETGVNYFKFDNQTTRFSELVNFA